MQITHVKSAKGAFYTSLGLKARSILLFVVAANRYRSGFQPSVALGGLTWGFAPCWYRTRLRRYSRADEDAGFELG